MASEPLASEPCRSRQSTHMRHLCNRAASAAGQVHTPPCTQHLCVVVHCRDPMTASLSPVLLGAALFIRAQDAAAIRDQIKEIEEANKPQPPDMQGLTTSSDTVTDGIRVKVRRCAVVCPRATLLAGYRSSAASSAAADHHDGVGSLAMLRPAACADTAACPDCAPSVCALLPAVTMCRRSPGLSLGSSSSHMQSRSATRVSRSSCSSQGTG